MGLMFAFGAARHRESGEKLVTVLFVLDELLFEMDEPGARIKHNERLEFAKRLALLASDPALFCVRRPM